MSMSISHETLGLGPEAVLAKVVWNMLKTHDQKAHVFAPFWTSAFSHPCIWISLA